MSKNVAILGSTGSVGRSALEVIEGLGEEYKVASLSANSNGHMLAEQAKKCGARKVALVSDSAANELRSSGATDASCEVLSGMDGVVELATDPEVDIVICSIVGAAALRPVLEAASHGKQLALANKEALVMAGDILMSHAAKNGSRIIPVDSEHSAIFQLLRAGQQGEIRRIILTASGGPFYRLPVERLAKKKPEEALKHPTWSMGRKISVDSATLMNKALEVIEAKWLFALDTSQIEVLVHPQSVVHSLVEFHDGSVLAQMGVPDMKTPIQYALTYPERAQLNGKHLDLTQVSGLTFEEPDVEKFPALRLGFRAAQIGGTMGAVLNAANEEAVDHFLNREIAFTNIATVASKVMDRHNIIAEPTLDDIIEADRWAREEAKSCLS